MLRRLAVIPALAAVLAGLSGIGWTGVARASGAHLTFQVSDAEAYAYKASVPQPVVQAAPKCDPMTDKRFHCDTYDHQPNCPPKVAFGAGSLPPDPQAPQTLGSQGISGGAGDTEGQDPTQTAVPQSSSIRLHRLYANGQLGDAGGVLSANGLSSLQYTDLGGPPWTNGYSHTETDAFTNQDNYEERCYATGSNGSYDAKTSSEVKPGDSYAHFFSHSFATPGTDEFTECFQSQCQFFFGVTASHGVSQLHLQQQGDTVNGVLFSKLVDLQFPGGFPLELHELQTYVEFESNGTPAGLRWQAVTSAQGATLAGQPVNLPTGKSFEFGQGDQAVTFGLSGPWVAATKDGGDLEMVAPGLFVATSQQTAFFAGAEVTANFGRAPGAPVFPTQPGSGGLPTSSSTSTGPSTGPTGSAVSIGSGNVNASSGAGGRASAQPPTGQALPQSTLLSKTDPPWAPVTIFGFGLLALLVVVLRWAQQFQWGRDLLTMRPLRGVEWLYRAFVKS